jgi:ABC-type amino acid transport substrate-binding protein
MSLRTWWIALFGAALGCGADRPPLPKAERDHPKQVIPAATEDSFSSTTLAALGRLVSQRWAFDLDSMIRRRAIRILVPSSRMLYFVDQGRLRGASYEAVAEFERNLNQKLRTGALPIECILIPVPRDQLISRLENGRGDVAVGAIQVTPERELRVDFSDPVLEGVREIVVTGPGAPAVRRIEDLAGP